MKLSAGLRAAICIGETQVPQCCPEDELTRDMLLGYLKAKGEIEEVRQVEVTVQMMDGSTFGEPSPWNAI